MDTSVDIDATVTYTEITPNIDPEILWEERKVQILDLCKSLWPSALDYACEDDQFSGGYNEVYFVSITQSPGVIADYVIRCPQERGSWTPVIDTVAILHHVRQTTSIRVPAVVAYDTTRDNALKSHYIIFERCPGESLYDVLDNFTPEQRTVLAEEIGELYRQLRETSSSYSARIIASPNCHLPSLRPEETLSALPIAIQPYGAQTPEEVFKKLPTSGEFGDIPESFLTSGGLTSDPPNLSLDQMVTRPWDRRLIQTTTMYPDADDMIRQMLNLYIMIETIVKEGMWRTTPTSFVCGTLISFRGTSWSTPARLR
jgi:hypothetical protein